MHTNIYRVIKNVLNDNQLILQHAISSCRAKYDEVLLSTSECEVLIPDKYYRVQNAEY